MTYGTCATCERVEELTQTGECRRCVGVGGLAKSRAAQLGPEPTAADLDAMIAEQLPTMPGGHDGVHGDGPRPPRVAKVLTNGRRVKKGLVE